MRPFDDIARLADAPALDRVAAPLRDAVHAVLRSRRFRDVLHGVWLGHPLHPMLVQTTIGAFTSSAVVDMLRGQHRAADTLIRVGLLTSLPAAAAGAADYSDGHEEQQRVGVVHAAVNVAALACYLTSLRLRAADRRPAGIGVGYAGLVLLAAGGALGGHLSYHLAQGANHAQGVPHTGPSEWADIGPVEELPLREPTRRMVGDIPAVVVRTDERTYVLADTCVHASAPLHQGVLVDSDGERCLQCPWHASVFRLSDGAVVHGPATMPQPRFDSRVVGGRVHARVLTFRGVPSAG